MRSGMIAVGLICLGLTACGSSDEEQPDTISPTLSVSVDNSAAWEQSSVSLTVNASDNEDSSPTTSINCDAGSVNGTTLTLPDVEEDTTITCTVTATDDAGNSSSRSVSIAVNAVVIALADATSNYTHGDRVEVNYTGPEIDVSDITVTFGSETLTLDYADGVIGFTIPDTIEGSDTLTIIIDGIESESVVLDVVALDTPESIVTRAIEVSEVEQAVTVQIPTAYADEQLFLINRFSEDVEVSASMQVSRINNNELLYIVNDEEEVMLLSQFLTVNSEEMEITPLTTAQALLSIFPDLSNFYLEDPAEFLSITSTDESVLALADVIANNTDWASGENAEVNEAIADVFNELPELLAGESRNTITTSGPINKIAKVNFTESDLDETKSGITLTVKGETSLSDSSEFTLQVENSFDRYAVLTVGVDSHDYGPNEYLIAPNFWDQKYPSYADNVLTYKNLIFDNYQALDEERRLYATVYGGSLTDGSSLIGLNSNEEEYYFTATMATVLHYISVPMIKSIINLAEDDHCLLYEWIVSNEDGHLVLNNKQVFNINYYASGNLIPDSEELTAQGQYTAAGLFLTTGINSFSDSRRDVLNCKVDVLVQQVLQEQVDEQREYLEELVREDIYRRLALGVGFSKVMGAVNEVLSARDLVDTYFISDPNLIYALENSWKYESWEITNENLTQSGQISFTSFTSLDVPTELTADYQFEGECPEDTICETLAMERERPSRNYFVEIEAFCENSGNSEECANLIAFLEDGTSYGMNDDGTLLLNGGEILLEFEYAKETYTAGNLEIYDLDRATTDFDFILQLKEAIPEIKLTEFAATDDIAGEIMNLTCEEGEETATIAFTVENTGVGNLYLTYNPIIVSGNPENWEIELQTDSTVLARGESATYAVTFQCGSAESYEELDLRFYDEYETTDIEVKKVNVVNGSLYCVGDDKGDMELIIDEFSDDGEPEGYNITLYCDSDEYGLYTNISRQRNDGDDGSDNTLGINLHLSHSNGNTYTSESLNYDFEWGIDEEFNENLVNSYDSMRTVEDFITNTAHETQLGLYLGKLTSDYPLYSLDESGTIILQASVGEVLEYEEVYQGTGTIDYSIGDYRDYIHKYCIWTRDGWIFGQKGTFTTTSATWEGITEDECPVKQDVLDLVELELSDSIPFNQWKSKELEVDVPFY